MKINKIARLKNFKISKKSSVNFIYLKNRIKNHKIACLDSLKALYQAPLSNIFTMVILGIALALPMFLYLIILNIDNNISSWQQGFYQYTVYLDSKYSEQEAQVIKNQILKWPEIKSVDLISKEQGLAELKSIMGLDDILSTIEQNPLPVVMTVNLKSQYQSLNTIKSLIEKSYNLTGVTKADADVLWLEKITQMLSLLSLVIYIFSITLATAVILVIANTIRLMLQNRQEEMTILSLLGATNSFIRQPYLYGGMFYGLFTGLLGLIVAYYLFNKLYFLFTELGVGALTNMNIISFTLGNILFFLIASCLLGWLGARISLYWQIKRLKSNLAEL